MLTHSVTTALVILLVPAMSVAQQTDTLPQPRGAVTIGMGAAYGGFAGVLGELYLGGPRLSALVGAGQSEGNWSCQCAAVSGSLRRYTNGLQNRLYIDVTGVYMLGDGEGERFIPVLLIGYANVAPSGFTLNAGLGLGRNRYRSLVPAVNIGLGYTWRERPST
jgi:hypothetical protein